MVGPALGTGWGEAAGLTPGQGGGRLGPHFQGGAGLQRAGGVGGRPVFRTSSQGAWEGSRCSGPPPRGRGRAAGVQDLLPGGVGGRLVFRTSSQGAWEGGRCSGPPPSSETGARRHQHRCWGHVRGAARRERRRDKSSPRCVPSPLSRRSSDASLSSLPEDEHSLLREDSFILQ